MAEQKEGITRRSVVKWAGRGTMVAVSGGAGYVAGVFDGKDSKPEPAQEEVDAMYKKIADHLKVKKSEADAANKPLIVLLGDTAPDRGRNPLVMQLIAIDVAADLGIKVLAPALDAERLGKLSRDQDGVLVDQPNMKPAMQHAAKRGMAIKAIDTYLEKKYKPNEERPDPRTVIKERSEEMSKMLSDGGKSAVAIVDDAHLRSMVGGELAKNAVVAAVSTITMDKHDRWLTVAGVNGKDARENLEFIKTSPDVLRVPMDASRLPDYRTGKAADMVQRAREYYQRENGVAAPLRAGLR